MINHTVLNAHSGQTDERLFIIKDGKIASYLDYSVYRSEPSIQMIKSLVPRAGYAKALVMKLQSLYPDTEIDWGMMTDEGAALKRSLRIKEIVDPVVKTKTDLLERVKAKLADLEANFDSTDIDRIRDYWNRLYDLERRIEIELEHAVLSKSIIVG